MSKRLGHTQGLSPRKRRVTPQEFFEHAYGQPWAQALGPEIATPPVSGESFRGPAQLTEVNGEAVVEVLPVEAGERFNLLEEPLIEGQPAYFALAGLSVACAELEGLSRYELGNEALAACYSPSAEAQELVRLFVEKVGLLSWGGLGHDCYEEQNKTPVLFEGKEMTSPRDGSTFRESRFLQVLRELRSTERYGNCVAWILQEALVLRRAMALWEALRRFRVQGDFKPLDRLWGRRRGTTPALFGHEFAVPNVRWEGILRLSVLELGAMISGHIDDTRPQARLVPHRWRRGKRTVGAYWLQPEMQFGSPLSGLWLQFYNDVMRGAEGGRHCQECGKPFGPKRVDQEFCCPKCKNRYHQRQYQMRRRLGEKEAKE